MGMSALYELFYRTLSDESHVNARSLKQEMYEVQTGDLSFGSKFGPAWEALLPSGRCVAEVMAQLNGTFGSGLQEHVEALAEEFSVALAAYQRFGGLP